jgi:exopolyphosphatase/guanosine-5'-triphosphate,3'-diphosphate pyrophosphatase
MHKIPLERVVSISEKLISLPLESRKNVKGLDPDRADLIIPGIRLTIKLMEKLGFNELVVSDYGLLEGVLLKLSEEVLS